MAKLYAMQDGADFYTFRDPEGETLTGTVTYPGRVRDFDMQAAGAARAWFVRWCETQGEELHWLP